MKRTGLWLGVALLGFSSGSLRAHEGQGHAETAQERGDETGARPPHSGNDFLRRLDEGLKLDADQKAKVRAILDESKPRMESLHKQMRGLEQEMRALLRGQMEKIRSLLNDDQKERFDEMKVRMHHEMRHIEKRIRIKGRPDRREDEDRAAPRHPGDSEEDEDDDDDGPKHPTKPSQEIRPERPRPDGIPEMMPGKDSDDSQ